MERFDAGKIFMLKEGKKSGWYSCGAISITNDLDFIYYHIGILDINGRVIASTMWFDYDDWVNLT